MADQIFQYGPYLLLGYVAFITGILSPGPNVLAIIGTSMGTSRRAGVTIACGISTGSFIWATFGVLGFTAVIASYLWLAIAMKIVGGLYLIWLGFSYLKSAYANQRFDVEKRVVEYKPTTLFLQGLAVQLTNPKAALYWISVMSLVLRPDSPSWVSIAMIIGIGIISFTGHIAWAVLFSSQRVVSFYQNFKVYVDGALGAFFTVIGAGMVFSLFKNGSKV